MRGRIKIILSGTFAGYVAMYAGLNNMYSLIVDLVVGVVVATIYFLYERREYIKMLRAEEELFRRIIKELKKIIKNKLKTVLTNVTRYNII